MKLSKIVAAVCAFSLIMTPSVSFAKTLELTLGSNDVYISDAGVSKQTVEVAPFTENGRTLVPVRIVSENFGLDVGWDDLTKAVTISDDTLKIKLVIGSNIADVNGEQVILDVPAIEKDGRTLVPVRFVAETLGKKVKWIEAGEQILITDEKTLLKAGDSEYTIDHYIALMALYGYNTEDITYMLTEFGKIKAEAKKNGYVFKNTDEVKQAYQSFLSSKDDIYSVTLFALFWDIIEETIMANEYVNTYIDNSLADVEVPDEQVAEEYNSSYVCAKHILISTVDMNTGEPISDSKKNTAKKIADTVVAKIKAGKDFDSLIEEYNEDPGMASNPSGYVFTKGEMVKEFEDAVYGMKEGEVSGIVETSYGYHIIKREKLPEPSEAVCAQIEKGILYNIGKEKYDRMLSNNTSEQFVSDEEITGIIYSMYGIN